MVTKLAFWCRTTAQPSGAPLLLINLPSTFYSETTPTQPPAPETPWPTEHRSIHTQSNLLTYSMHAPPLRPSASQLCPRSTTSPQTCNCPSTTTVKSSSSSPHRALHPRRRPNLIIVTYRLGQISPSLNSISHSSTTNKARHPLLTRSNSQNQKLVLTRSLTSRDSVGNHVSSTLLAEACSAQQPEAYANATTPCSPVKTSLETSITGIPPRRPAPTFTDLPCVLIHLHFVERRRKARYGGQNIKDKKTGSVLRSAQRETYKRKRRLSPQ